MSRRRRRRKPSLEFTDHAIVRYLERVLKMDLSKLKQQIVPKATKELIEILGDGEFPCGEYNVVVKNKTIITVIEAK